MSEARKHRSFTPEQKIEIVLAGLRGDRPVREVCRAYEVSEALYYQWRERLLEGGKAALGTARDKKPPEAAELAELKKKVSQLERALGRKTYELDLAWEALRGLGVNERVARSRALIAKGHRPAVVTRVLQVSRQSVYRPISRRPAGAGPGRGWPGDEAIVEVAKANPTDGTRMVAAIAGRELGAPVNRKRVQRVMRQHRLLQRSRNTDRRRRPGFFRVTRPDELWHLDMTKVWTAAHGWVYLHVAVDCCTRQVACWRVDLRTRSQEAIAGGDRLC